MISNKYMIVTPVPANDSTCWQALVQNPLTVRKSLDETKCVVKLPVGSTDIPPCMDQTLTLYSHAEILTILDGPEWTPEAPEE